MQYSGSDTGGINRTSFILASQLYAGIIGEVQWEAMRVVEANSVRELTSRFGFPRRSRALKAALASLIRRQFREVYANSTMKEA
jgi:hypothetical protein